MYSACVCGYLQSKNLILVNKVFVFKKQRCDILIILYTVGFKNNSYLQSKCWIKILNLGWMSDTRNKKRFQQDVTKILLYTILQVPNRK